MNAFNLTGEGEGEHLTNSPIYHCDEYKSITNVPISCQTYELSLVLVSFKDNYSIERNFILPSKLLINYTANKCFVIVRRNKIVKL